MKILFMCVANSARSQLAEGLAKKIMGPNIEIQSAGSKPSRVNPYAMQVLSEMGIDISNQSSKSVDDLPSHFIENLDYVITLCKEEVCPIIISKVKKIHWPLADPAGTGTNEEQLERFRATSKELNHLISDFISDFKLSQILRKVP